MGPKLGSGGATACVEVGDDQVGAKNTEPDGPIPRGEGLLVRGYEFSSSLTSQEHPLAPLLLWEISDVIYHFFWFILSLHLLVIHAHT